MTLSSCCFGDIPFEEEEIIEAMSINFDVNVDLLELDVGINFLGFIIADVEPGTSCVKATLLGMWCNYGQIRIIHAKRNVFFHSCGPWNVKARAIVFPFDIGSYITLWMTLILFMLLTGYKLMESQRRCFLSLMVENLGPWWSRF